MDEIESAHRAGVLEAQRDIARGQLKLRYGARGAWGEDFARMLESRFGVELVVLSCFVSKQSTAFENGYNTTVEAHLDGVHGSGSVAAVWDEVQHRREAAYEACGLVPEAKPTASVTRQSDEFSRPRER